MERADGDYMTRVSNSGQIHYCHVLLCFHVYVDILSRLSYILKSFSYGKNRGLDYIIG